MRVPVMVLAAILLLSGCATLRLTPPHLQVVGVSLLGANLLQQQLRVRVRVDNPNKTELQVRGIDCEVQLAGATFASGASERDFVVPALGAMEFDVDVTANAAAALLRLLGSRERGSTEYRVTGTVHLAKGFIKDVPFEHKGDLLLR
jgi:LEA14-like dessication related protein